MSRTSPTKIYTRIPDAESGDSSSQTPQSRAISFQRRWLIGSSAALFFLIAIYYAITYIGTTIFAKSLTIYGTSMKRFRNKDAMTQVHIQEMIKYVESVHLDSIAFGNVMNCKNMKSIKYRGDKVVECCSAFVRSKPALLLIDQTKISQKITGFGGAFTEATALSYNKLPKKSQQKLMEMYFGQSGIGFTLGRISINSCDFSKNPYNFDNIKNDYSLEYFDTEVTHDNAYIIPMIRQAMEKSIRRIKIMASPWSPPSWMKKVNNGTHSMLSSAVPNGLSDDPNIQQAWALYISKFITAYNYKGVPIWAITPQNEPEFAAPWEACAYDAEGERDFINNHLGPILRTDHKEVLILAYDHNKDNLKQWADTILGGDEAGYVDGMAFHWYSAFDRVSDGTYGYNEVNSTHHAYPDKLLIATEGCSCPGVDLDNWLRAERLAHDIIFDLRNYAQGWIDWNLLLDSDGGPNHLDNNCDASLIANPDFSDFHIQPKYYYFGHISKFVPPGSVRIESYVIGDYEFVDTGPNVQGNFEVGLFGCEKSTRQVWKWGKPGDRLELRTEVDASGAQSLDPQPNYEAKKVRYCVSKGEKERKGYLRLSDCDADTTDAKISFVRLTRDADGRLVDLDTGLCLTVADGVREEGALLQLRTCIVTSDQRREPINNEHQIFDWDVYTGEIRAQGVGNFCLTAGWPMLTTVAFKTEQHTVVVVMNEADLPTSVLLLDESRHNKPMAFAIDARSIQTIVY